MQRVSLATPLAAWDRPLRTWFTVLDRYRKASRPRDGAYWYNERATLSTLAGALWLSGALVLEEYATRRGGDGPEAGNGRTDLWCQIEASRFTIEAKQSKSSYRASPDKLESGASWQLDVAAKQCSNDNFGARKRLAMVFMVPRLREQPTEGDLEAWAKAVATFRADMKAYDLRTPALRSSTNGRFFPGVILLARIVRAPHR